MESTTKIESIIFGDGSGNILNDGFIGAFTQDTTISVHEASGGTGDIIFEHYGNYKYNGRAYFKNTGSRNLRIKTYIIIGHLVHDFKLEPEKDSICYFNQSILKENLVDGKGIISIQTFDGGDGKVNFMYNIFPNSNIDPQYIFEHYGNYKYNGRAYFKNTSSEIVRIKTYTTTGYLVYDFELEPEEDNVCYFNQSILKWELADGIGIVKAENLEGKDEKIYFNYTVLD